MVFEYIQESGQLPIGGDLAELRRAIAVSAEGNFWAILPAEAVCRRSPIPDPLLGNLLEESSEIVGILPVPRLDRSQLSCNLQRV